MCRLLCSNTQYPNQQTIARANEQSYQNFNNSHCALSLLTPYYFSTALFFCFAAQFLRSLRTNPGAKPSDTKGAGNHDLGRAKFCPLRPRPAGPETARTAGRSGRAGAFTTPALSPAFFHTGPAPRRRKRHISRFRPTGRKFAHLAAPPLLTEPACARLRRKPSFSRHGPQFASKPLVGAATLPSPQSGHTAAHGGQTTVKLLTLFFSLYCVLVLDILFFKVS